MSNQSIFPFLPDNANALPQVLPYDLAINKPYPGLELEPTEPNGQYQVVREVSGSLWLVTNADWNANTLRWEQDNLCNPLEPAYALALQGDGSMVRYEGAATEYAGQPVAFVPLFKIDAAGLITHSPLVTVSSSGVAETENLTWDAGTAVVLTANQLNIIDTASSPMSLVDAVYVNGTEVWAVQKDGTLVAGKVPFSLITGFTAAFNNASFTGTTTFNGPVVANNGITTNTLTATTSITAPTYLFTSGGRAPDTPTEVQQNFTAPAIGSTVALTVYAATYLPVGTTVIIAGNSNAAGGHTSFTGYVTATNLSFGLPSTIITVQAVLYQQGEAGDIVLAGTPISYTTVTQLTSPNASIDIGNAGSAAAPSITVDIDQYATPLNVATYTTVPVGSTVSISCQKTRNFAYDAYVMVQGTTTGITLVGQVVQSGTQTNINPSTIVIRVLQYFLGGPGVVVGPGQSTITNGSYNPPIPPTYTAFQRIVTPYPNTTLTVGPLAGGSSQQYRLLSEMTFDTNGGGTQVITGSGASWETPVPDPDIGGPQLVDLTGTAVGGQSPSATWSQTGGPGGDGYAGVFRLMAFPVL